MTNIFAEPERWSTPAAVGDAYIITDPVSGEPANLNAVPPWVDAEPELHTGLEYLRAYGKNVGVTLVRGRHKEPEDLGDSAKGWFEAQVAASDYYAFEAYGFTQARLEARRSTAAERFANSLAVGTDLAAYIKTPDPLKSDRKTGIAWRARIWRAIAMNAATTTSFPSDLSADATPLETKLFEAARRIARMPAGVEASIALRAIHNVRDLIGVARTGLEVSKGERDNEPRAIKVFETIGAAHEEKAAKYAALHVRVRSVGVRPENWSERPLVRRFPEIVRTGVVLQSDLPVLTRVHLEERAAHDTGGL